MTVDGVSITGTVAMPNALANETVCFAEHVHRQPTVCLVLHDIVDEHGADVWSVSDYLDKHFKMHINVNATLVDELKESDNEEHVGQICERLIARVGNRIGRVIEHRDIVRVPVDLDHLCQDVCRHLE